MRRTLRKPAEPIRVPGRMYCFWLSMLLRLTISWKRQEFFLQRSLTGECRVLRRSGHHFRYSILSFGEQNEGSGVLAFVMAALEFVIMLREFGSCQLAG